MSADIQFRHRPRIASKRDSRAVAQIFVATLEPDQGPFRIRLSPNPIPAQ